MFAKAFRVKSHTAIRGSDRRKLRADVAAAFPTLGTDQVSALVPGKEELNIVKLYAHRGDAVTVYVCGGNPILFELEKNLYPTVYTLWSYPDLLPTFTTWPLVLEKLVGGADFMLPGLMVPPVGLPRVQKGNLCALALVGNRAHTQQSSEKSELSKYAHSLLGSNKMLLCLVRSAILQRQLQDGDPRGSTL